MLGQLEFMPEAFKFAALRIEMILNEQPFFLGCECPSDSVGTVPKNIQRIPNPTVLEAAAIASKKLRLSVRFPPELYVFEKVPPTKHVFFKFRSGPRRASLAIRDARAEVRLEVC